MDNSVENKLSQVGKRIVGRAKAAKAKFEAVRNCIMKIKKRLGSMYRDVLDYIEPEVKDADQREKQWIVQGAVSVLRVLNEDDPLQNFCNMSSESRLAVLTQIDAEFSELFGISVCEVISVEMRDDLQGFYSDDGTIWINKIKLGGHPMSKREANAVICTFMHEKFHCFQYTVMGNPKKYAVPLAIARMWRWNYWNYIPFEENPKAYVSQPLEVSARWFEEGVGKIMTENQEYRQMILRDINGRTAGGDD